MNVFESKSEREIGRGGKERGLCFHVQTERKGVVAWLVTQKTHTKYKLRAQEMIVTSE